MIISPYLPKLACDYFYHSTLMYFTVGRSISSVYSGQERNGGKTHTCPENGTLYDYHTKKKHSDK